MLMRRSCSVLYMHTICTSLFVCQHGTQVQPPECIVMLVAELKALHDSIVELYMQQPYGCCLHFFHTVFTPACQNMGSCGRGRGKLVSPQHDVRVSSIANLIKTQLRKLWTLGDCNTVLVQGMHMVI